jgi:N6-L-threonylcarbamoyladenine synthase
MNLLGIETSCDETAVAVLRNGQEILSNLVLSQSDIHEKYGGIVPELACRRHIGVISRMVRDAVEKAGITLRELDAVAVTAGPGLIGALLVGVSFAKGLAYGIDIPMMAVNHLEGHLWAISLQEEVPPPFISLLVSGGHTQIYYVKGFGDYESLGGTLDDAAGEVFDKVARVLGLGFPGGPAIERMALRGDPKRFSLPRGLLSRPTLDFSFSGLKSAVARQIMKEFPGRLGGAPMEPLPGEDPAAERFRLDMSASFQEAVVDVLVSKTITAAVGKGAQRIVLSGGVACNQVLRSRMQEAAKPHQIGIYFPNPVYCTDNAAMIAWVGYRHYQAGRFAPLDLNPQARMPLGELLI